MCSSEQGVFLEKAVDPFVWCVWAFDFASWLGTFRFEFSSELTIFVILFFPIWHTFNKQSMIKLTNIRILFF